MRRLAPRPIRGRVRSFPPLPFSVIFRLPANFRSCTAVNRDSERLCISKHGGENCLAETRRTGIEMRSRPGRNHPRVFPRRIITLGVLIPFVSATASRPREVLKIVHGNGLLCSAIGHSGELPRTRQLDCLARVQPTVAIEWAVAVRIIVSATRIEAITTLTQNIADLVPSQAWISRDD